MAARESDMALWLHNKLGSTDDLWSGSTICSQLSREKLIHIQDSFHNLQPHVKVKLLLSFLHIPKRNIEEWRHELEDLIHTAADDTDQWVTMVAEILRTFPTTGALNTDIEEHQSSFHDILTELKKTVRRSQETRMAPLECSHLSRNAQISVTGHLPQPVKHFALKRKSKAAALRAELLQKAAEAANQKKSTGGVSLPLKIRSFAKKLDDSTPMKGIPNPASTGFLRSNSLGSRFGGAPLGQRNLVNRREGGIKLLEIGDQPVGVKEAKRRRKQAEQEAVEVQKKEKEAQANTPDYAAGLVNTVLSGVELGTSAASYVPTGVTRIPAPTPTSVTPVAGVSVATQQARDNLQQQLNHQVAPTQPVTITTAAPTTATVNNQQQVVTIVTQPAPTPPAITLTTNTQQPVPLATGQTNLPNKKGLSLTREQMFAAQEMFKTSNKVTRPEKALILGFMAGSRDNPCPQQGDVVNIRLSEDMESIQQPDGLFKPMTVDTYIQMNYSSGTWKRIKKYHEMQQDVE